MIFCNTLKDIMSGGTEWSYAFEDYYKTDLDDSELQARLYAEIYYESNIEGESRAMNSPRTIQYNNTTIEKNVALEKLRHKSKEQPLASNIQESQKTQSTDQTESVEVVTLPDREMNSVAHQCNNESPEEPSTWQEKKGKQYSSKKFKSSKRARNEQQETPEKDDTTYSKYNVISKCAKQKKLLAKQVNEDIDSSDSEKSIFEVPVPPKPKPLLIDLQDSDEENGSNSGTDDLILKKWGNNASMRTYSRKSPLNDRELEVIETSSDHHDISPNSKITARSYNKDTVNPDRSIRTSTYVKITEDMLNCTTIQRGAESLSEILQSSKSCGINEGIKSTEDTDQNSMNRSPQNKSKGNNEINFPQEMSASEKKSQMRTQQNDNTTEMESCNLVTDLKRQCNEEVNSPKQPEQKRQCLQLKEEDNQDVISQGNNVGEERNASPNEFFNQMSENIKNFYNSIRPDNFDVDKLQQSMSKDPKMWIILDEDIMPRPSIKQRTRFWNVRCTHCHQEGHRRYDCRMPRRTACCYMCGKKGHTELRCPEKMCLTCGKQQNTFRNICEYCRALYCTMCHSIGHKVKQCPDLWRRYHHTTDMNSALQDPGDVMKPVRLLYCCNCTKRGHESAMCKEYRWSEYLPTPASVTNYTDGPTYAQCTSSSSGPDPEIDFFRSLKTRENKTSIPRNVTDIQLAIEQAMIEDFELSADVDTSSPNDNFCVSSTPQEAAIISQVQEDSPVVDYIWPGNEKTQQTSVQNVNFNKIIFSYGIFYKKNNKGARMIMKNLNMFYQKRISMLNSLKERKVAPNFLTVLLEKAVEFEVNIGFTHKRTLCLQVIAMKEYIQFLYELLRYWLNLSDDEKDYGIDVSLPINPTKMYNLLNTRMPQLDKMRFTCYAEHIGGVNDPRLISNLIKNDKAQLKQYEGTKNYNRLRTKLWRLQIRLLMIVNTEPTPNSAVKSFQKMMDKFESDRHLMHDKLDTATYLQFILLYNRLFVPHTAETTDEMLKRVKMEEKKIQKSRKVQQKPKIIAKIVEKGNLVYNVYSSSAESCTSQNFNLESFSAINNQQNNEILVKGQNENNTSLETNKTTDRICDEITLIDSTQDSQIIAPLKPEPASKLEQPGKNENQLSTSEVNINSNVSAPYESMKKERKKINVTEIHRISRILTKKERKKLIQNAQNPKKIYDTAYCLVERAHSFNVPHMKHLANEMQRHIHNQTITPKRVRKLINFIILEQKRQQTCYTYWRKQ